MSATLILPDLARLEQLYTAGFHDPFLDNALRKMVARQIARDQADLARLVSAIAEFEQSAGMSSDEFFRRYQDGEIPDTVEATEWNALCKMRQRIIARLEILRGASTHA